MLAAANVNKKELFNNTSFVNKVTKKSIQSFKYRTQIMAMSSIRWRSYLFDGVLFVTLLKTVDFYECSHG